MRCPYCGQRLPDRAGKCPSGGHVLTPADWEAGAKLVTKEEIREPERPADGGFQREQRAQDPSDGRFARTQASHSAAGQAVPRMGMKWYWFVSRISLLLSAVNNIVVGTQYVMGQALGTQSADYYGKYPAMNVLDRIYGIVMILVGMYAFVVRTRLIRRKASGPSSLIRLYVISLVSSGIYIAVAMLATGTNLLTWDLILSVGISLLMILINRIYFDKRKQYFQN